MSDAKVHPDPKVPRRSKAILWLLAVVIVIVGAYSLHVMSEKPTVDVKPPASGLTDGTG